VLETIFLTDDGAVRITDALRLPDDGLVPYRELLRKVDGLSGSVPMCWRLEPRFGYAGRPLKLAYRGGVPVARAGSDAVAVQSFDAGDPEVAEHGLAGRFDAAEGSSGLLALSFAHQEPLLFPRARRARGPPRYDLRRVARVG
jgi:hypothetical protein